MKTNCISVLRKHLPLNSGWSTTRPQFAGIEYDSEGFGK